MGMWRGGRVVPIFYGIVPAKTKAPKVLDSRTRISGQGHAARVSVVEKADERAHLRRATA
jgi:hypothetical protein